MISRSVAELRADLADALRAVAAGEEVVVTNRGVPVAKLVMADASQEERFYAIGGKAPKNAGPVPTVRLKKTKQPELNLTREVLRDRRL